jgi:nicotinamide phosphoribosyltransferase
MGTDTMSALALLRDHYKEHMAGFSIAATEHSVMTAGGPQGEIDVVRRILAATPPDQMVAMVGDSFDMIEFVKTILATPDIKADIEKRSAPVIVRPDSGDPVEMDLKVFKALAGVFGVSTNAKGYAVLPPYIRMIQGDGIEWYQREVERDDYHNMTRSNYLTYGHTVEDILQNFERAGISADNIAFGSGGGLLQKWNRDTQRMAIKCSWMQIDGEGHDIFKKPKTDPTKDSKRGRLALIEEEGELITVQEKELITINTIPNRCGTENLLQTVFENGVLMNRQSLSDIRHNAQN